MRIVGTIRTYFVCVIFSRAGYGIPFDWKGSSRASWPPPTSRDIIWAAICSFQYVLVLSLCSVLTITGSKWTCFLGLSDSFLFFNLLVESYRSLERNTQGQPEGFVSLAKWRILNRLHDRNETLYYRVSVVASFQHPELKHLLNPLQFDMFILLSSLGPYWQHPKFCSNNIHSHSRTGMSELFRVI